MHIGNSRPSADQRTRDVDLLKQLLLNLTENALTHAGQPCTVKLSLTLSHGLPPQLANTAHSEQHDWAVLSVYDTGPGIDPDDLPHSLNAIIVQNMPASA